MRKKTFWPYLAYLKRTGSVENQGNKRAARSSGPALRQ
jgi:hypothetical protein